MNEDINIAGRAKAAICGDELAWRAFRYLHGELTADEAEAFEEDLAVEQQAREALAQAVELTTTLGTISLETIALKTIAREAAGNETRTIGVLSRRRWSRRQVLVRASVVGASIAACLAVVVTLGLTGRFGSTDPGHRGPTDPGNAHAALAEAWAGIGGDEWHHSNNSLQEIAAPPAAFSPDTIGSDTIGSDTIGPGSDEDRLHADQGAELSVPSVPSWLLAALDPQPGETPEIEDMKEIKQ